MNVLVTGGAGFIGSHMVDALINQGNNVFVLDSLMCGSLENLKHLEKNDKFFFKQLDITKLDPFVENFAPEFFGEKAAKKGKTFHRIFHMACPASPVTYQKDPVHTLLTGVMGTHFMLEIAKKHKARILFTSTSEVYGDPLEHPQKESYWGNVNCTGIRSCYDEGKRAAETLCFDYHRTRGVDVRVVRIFNTYGPRMMIDDGRIVSNFVVQALQGTPLTVYGSGKQTRSFCFIDDNIRGLLAMMEQEKTIGPVNIGNPMEFTVMELAEKVKQIVGNDKVKIEYQSLPSDDPKQRKPDISKAKEILSWEPKIFLDEGLKLTVEEFKQRLQNQKP